MENSYVNRPLIRKQPSLKCGLTCCHAKSRNVINGMTCLALVFRVLCIRLYWNSVDLKVENIEQHGHSKSMSLFRHKEDTNAGWS